MTDPTQPRTRSETRRLTHIDRGGRPRMVDVSLKPPTARRAVAEAEVVVEQETLSLVIDGDMSKGDVLTVGELAGVMGGKRTAELIPLCHPIAFTDLTVEIRPDRAESLLRVRASAATVGPTGVEMEAMTAAAVAALTVYDMVKGVDRSAEIRNLRLIEKSGGRSGEWHRPEPNQEAARRPPARPRGVRGPLRRG